jgi:hypothetical protein
MIERKIEKLIEEAFSFLQEEEEEEKWSQDVKEKFHPPEGTFKEGSADKIATIISQNGRTPYKTAIARLNFFLNRGGENVSPEIRAKVNRAKEILKKRYNKKD